MSRPPRAAQSRCAFGCRSNRLPILVVYLLVLCGSSIGRAGLLGFHLVVDHHAVEQHAGIALDEPHEHDGMVHSHDDAPEGQLAVSPAGISKHFVCVPPSSGALPTSSHACFHDHLPPPADRVRLVEVPPPRLLS
ncbi:MAG: hypothetical protein WD766_03495 [Gemmatimonadota bacterium]